MSDFSPTVFVVDDDPGFLDSAEVLCRSVGLESRLFASGEELLAAWSEDWQGVILLDVRMPKLSGLEVQQRLTERSCRIPILFITAHGDIEMAVTALKRGAFDFLTKPFRQQDLIDRIHAALREAGERHTEDEVAGSALADYETLTAREREVFHLVVEGCANKVIANRLEISERTVELHRSHAMTKMRSQSLAELVRRALLIERLQSTD